MLEVLERLDGPLTLQHLLGRAEVKLEYVQVVGLHTPQALVDGVDDMLTAVVVEPGSGVPYRVRSLGENRLTSSGQPHLEARKNS